MNRGWQLTQTCTCKPSQKSVCAKCNLNCLSAKSQDKRKLVYLLILHALNGSWASYRRWVWELRQAGKAAGSTQNLFWVSWMISEALTGLTSKLLVEDTKTLFRSNLTVFMCWVDVEPYTGDRCKNWPTKKSLPEFLDLWSIDWSNIPHCQHKVKKCLFRNN